MTEELETRRRIMQAVKSRDTTPERLVRKLCWSLGCRYRLYSSKLPGKPDLVFPGRRKVIFVHGCFSHGHDCKRGRREPKTNLSYWRSNIARNRARDKRNAAALEGSGWVMLTIWECELANRRAVLDRLVEFLEDGHTVPRLDGQT